MTSARLQNMLQSSATRLHFRLNKRNFWWCFAFGACLLLSLPCQAADLVELQNCELLETKWADGDSFLVRSPERGEFTLRLYGADCLEWHVTDHTDERRLRAQRRYFGITKARADARTSIEMAKGYGEAAGKEVRRNLAKPFTVYTAFADARGDGCHKRIYGFVITGEGGDLAAELVSKGLARAFGVYRKTWDNRTHEEYREHLKDLELRAASQDAGVWAETDWANLPEERRLQREEDREAELAFDHANLRDGEKIDPNTAARDDLMRLPEIGEVMANRIIEGRPYAKLEDLQNVSGIGRVTFEKISPYLQLSAD